MRKLLIIICILASGFLFMSLPEPEAALTPSLIEVPGIFALLLLGSGMVGLGVYGRRRLKK